MDYNKEEEKEKSSTLFVSILAVLILLIAIFAISFVTITFTEKGTESNTIRTGEIRMSYTENTNGISIENALPISDDIGMKMNGIGQYFDFVVATRIKGETTLAYEISAEKDVNSTLKDEQVKLYLEKKKGASYEQEMAPTVFTPITEKTKWGTEKGMMLLTSGTSSKTEDVSYRLRMWIKQDAVLNGTSETFIVRVHVKGGVVVE